MRLFPHADAYVYRARYIETELLPHGKSSHVKSPPARVIGAECAHLKDMENDRDAIREVASEGS